MSIAQDIPLLHNDVGHTTHCWLALVRLIRLTLTVMTLPLGLIVYRYNVKDVVSISSGTFNDDVLVLMNVIEALDYYNVIQFLTNAL